MNASHRTVLKFFLISERTYDFFNVLCLKGRGGAAKNLAFKLTLSIFFENMRVPQKGLVLYLVICVGLGVQK